MRNRTELLRALITTVLGLVALPVGDWFYGAYRWNARTQELQARLGAARVPVCPRTADTCELQCLPAPVQRYFRVVLKGGQPMVASVRVQYRGTFNIGQITDQRKPFKSE